MEQLNRPNLEPYYAEEEKFLVMKNCRLSSLYAKHGISYFVQTCLEVLFSHINTNNAGIPHYILN